jgi:hypothetical protein
MIVTRIDMEVLEQTIYDLYSRKGSGAKDVTFEIDWLLSLMKALLNNQRFIDSIEDGSTVSIGPIEKKGEVK